MVTWPRSYLCASVARFGSVHNSGPITERPRLGGRQRAGGHADIPEHGLTAQIAARQQQMTRLETEKRDRQRCLRHQSSRRAGRAIQSARHVDRHDPARRPQHGDHGRVQFPAEARAENGVDDQRRPSGFLRREGHVGTAPSGGGPCRVRPSPRRRQGRDRHRPSLLGEQARHDIAIAAVIPWPTQHQNAARPEARLDGSRDGPPGVRHQRGSRHSQARRGRVHLRHFVGGQQFVARAHGFPDSRSAPE